MNNSVELRKENITFIGAGIATAYALLRIMKILKEKPLKKPLKVRIIDKSSDFFTGIPYGERSGKSVLLINALSNFLPADERQLFVLWLEKNKGTLLNEFLEHGGERAKIWLQNNKPSIDSNTWDDLYIPRFFFGRFIKEKITGELSSCLNNGLIEMTYTIDEVVDVSNKANSFEILLKNEISFTSKDIVLSIGSLPTRRIFKEDLIIKGPNYLVLNDIYNKDLSSNISLIKEFLKSRKGKKTNVLVIGANASGLETLYSFVDHVEINEHIQSYTVLSSHGLMPDSDIDYEKRKEFKPKSLRGLRSKDGITASDIAKAAYKDLDRAHEISLGAASTVDSISNEIGNLLGSLNLHELENFACFYGNDIGRKQRCAGSHYTNVVKELKQKGKLNHIAGRFLKIHEMDDKDGLIVSYMDTQSQQESEIGKRIHLAINCMGATTLENYDTPEFLTKLISKSLVVPNKSKIGFKINSDFESSDNFFVAGPLLAGNVIENKAMWHLEHCGRIIWSSSLLADRLMNKVVLSERSIELNADKD